jgi:hypothetical protein
MIGQPDTREAGLKVGDAVAVGRYVLSIARFSNGSWMVHRFDIDSGSYTQSAIGSGDPPVMTALADGRVVLAQGHHEDRTVGGAIFVLKPPYDRLSSPVRLPLTFDPYTITADSTHVYLGGSGAQIFGIAVDSLH